jgi:ferric-dicitrate binding protein FerR (iron transport regulator)
VKSKLLDVKVYGTSFNICCYPEDKDFSATLVKGSISILDKEGNEISKLKPGDKAVYAENESNITVFQTNTSLYTSWKEGLITYRNEKMKDIARQIERWYNVEIVIQKEGLGEERYFGTILKNKPIDQILEVFKLTTSLECEIIPRTDKPTLIYWK